MDSMPNSRSLMPFTALVGQEAMKTALVLNAINPGIGGVLIRGPARHRQVHRGPGAGPAAPRDRRDRRLPLSVRSRRAGDVVR